MHSIIYIIHHGWGPPARIKIILVTAQSQSCFGLGLIMTATKTKEFCGMFDFAEDFQNSDY